MASRNQGRDIERANAGYPGRGEEKPGRKNNTQGVPRKNMSAGGPDNQLDEELRSELRNKNRESRERMYRQHREGNEEGETE